MPKTVSEADRRVIVCVSIKRHVIDEARAKKLKISHVCNDVLEKILAKK